MTQFVLTPQLKHTRPPGGGSLGVGTKKMREPEPPPYPQEPEEIDYPADFPASQEKKIRKPQGETLEKVVKRIPTLYVIVFLTVFTACAVLIIWNTLQVNRLSYEKSRLESKIEQSEQRIIKLKAQEMQLSAPDRVREIAVRKLGMTEITGNDEVIVK